MLSLKGSSPFTSNFEENIYSLGEIGKHDGFKIHSYAKVIGSNPIASIIKISLA